MHYMNNHTDSWFNDQGNFCFNWKTENPKYFLASLTGIIFILVISFIIDYFFGTCFSLFAVGVIFVVVICWYIGSKHESEKEDKLMLSLVEGNMDVLIGSYIAQSGKPVKERKRKVFIKTKGTYGIITGASILCLLSDGSVIEYALIWHLSDEKQYYELSKNPIVCSEESKLKEIIPHYAIKKLLKRISLSENSKLVVIIITTIVISFLAAGIFFGIIYLVGFKLFCVSSAIYIVLTFVSHFVSTKVRQLSFINSVIDVPFFVFGVIADLGQPFFVIMMSVISPIAAVVAPLFLCISLVEFCLGEKISYDLLIFILLTTSQIFCVHVPNFTRWVIRSSPLKNWENHRYEKYREELALYITSPKSYNFMFSVLYVVFLTLCTIWQLEFHSNLFTADIDNAIIKAFLVFLAFSAMRQKTKEIDIKAKDLLPKIFGLFEHDEVNDKPK